VHEKGDDGDENRDGRIGIHGMRHGAASARHKGISDTYHAVDFKKKCLPLHRRVYVSL